MSQKRYSAEFKERAIRMVVEGQKAGDTQWGSVRPVSQKLGCTPEALRRWVRQWERDQGKRDGMTTAEADNPTVMLASATQQ